VVKKAGSPRPTAIFGGIRGQDSYLCIRLTTNTMVSAAAAAAAILP
jgi:hypothetical protein